MPLSDKQQQQFNAICIMIEGGLSLRKACIETGKQYEDGIKTYGGFNNWRRTEDEDGALALQYAQARVDRADYRSDEIVELADDQSIEPNSRKIMVDARKWEASKLNPRIYGDKLALGGAADLPPIRQEVSEKADAFTDTLAGLARRADAAKETRH